MDFHNFAFAFRFQFSVYDLRFTFCLAISSERARERKKRAHVSSAEPWLTLSQLRSLCRSLSRSLLPPSSDALFLFTFLFNYLILHMSRFLNEFDSDKSNSRYFYFSSLYLFHSLLPACAKTDDVVSLDYTSDSTEFHNCSSDCSVGCHASNVTLTEKQRTHTRSPTQTLSSICSTTSPSTASNDSDSLFGNGSASATSIPRETDRKITIYTICSILLYYMCVARSPTLYTSCLHMCLTFRNSAVLQNLFQFFSHFFLRYIRQQIEDTTGKSFNLKELGMRLYNFQSFLINNEKATKYY